MDKLRRQALYNRICESFIDFVMSQHGIGTDGDSAKAEMARIVGITESTLEKILIRQTKGLKLSVEQVVSLAELMKIDPAEFLKSPDNQDDKIVQAISDLYDFCEAKGRDFNLTGLVNTLAKYFECEPVWMQGKLFELMEINRIGVENGRFFEVVDEKA